MTFQSLATSRPGGVGQREGTQLRRPRLGRRSAAPQASRFSALLMRRWAALAFKLMRELMRECSYAEPSNEFLANFPLLQPIEGCFQAFARNAGAPMPAAHEEFALAGVLGQQAPVTRFATPELTLASGSATLRNLMGVNSMPAVCAFASSICSHKRLTNLVCQTWMAGMCAD